MSKVSATRLALLFGLLLLAAACVGDDDVAQTPPPQTGAATGAEEMIVTSNIFTDGGRIPVAYTCDSDNISPDVQWSGAPDATVSFALIMDDPDANGFIHWVVYSIPGNAIGVPPGVTDEATLANGSVQGSNGRGQIGYTGPCPPSGEHTYVFAIYALDAELELGSGATADEVTALIDPHVLEAGRITGTYSR